MIMNYISFFLIFDQELYLSIGFCFHFPSRNCWVTAHEFIPTLSQCNTRCFLKKTLQKIKVKVTLPRVRRGQGLKEVIGIFREFFPGFSMNTDIRAKLLPEKFVLLVIPYYFLSVWFIGLIASMIFHFFCWDITLCAWLSIFVPHLWFWWC